MAADLLAEIRETMTYQKGSQFLVGDLYTRM
jgi:hypothetical protein